MPASITSGQSTSERYATVRFSTADYAPQERLGAWHDIYCRTFVNLDIEPIETGSPRADVTIRKLPGLSIMTGSRSAALYRRSRQRIDNDDIVLSVGLAGTFEAAQSGRGATMARGDAVVVTGAEPGYVAFPSSGRSLTFSLPARAMSGLGPTMCRRIPSNNAALQLLTQYVGILEHHDALAVPALQHHAVTHIHDLIALALGAARDGAKARGASAARLHAIKADIADNLARDDLSVATVAARHRLPVRYVQRLFEADGMTFTDFVLDARLASAHRVLIDPRRANLKIAAIASEAGFGDPSYFNRTFRRRYAASPSDVRAQARHS